MSNMQLIPFKLCCIDTITAPSASRSFLNVIRARKPRAMLHKQKNRLRHTEQKCRIAGHGSATYTAAPDIRKR